MQSGSQNPFRFAGDVFSGGGSREERDESKLVDYFPALKDFDKRISGEPSKGAKTTGGFEAIQPFTGFKKFESETDLMQVPQFGGFKPMERNQ